MIASDRASRLPAYADCARRWAALRFWPEGYGLHQTPSSIALVGGKATHAGQETMMLDYQSAGAPPATPRRGIEAALESYLDSVGIERPEYDDVTPESDAEHAIRRMVETVHRAIEPGAEPELIERGMAARINDSEISCTVDLFVVGGKLKDLKTSTRKPRRPDIQMGAQSLVTRANLGERVKGLVMTHVKRVPVAKEQPPAEDIAIQQGAAERLVIETVKHMERSVQHWQQTGDPAAFSANPGSFMCNPKYCAAYGSKWCDAWRVHEGAN
jgi:PD-(D/E)XK nuclease superfamily